MLKFHIWNGFVHSRITKSVSVTAADGDVLATRCHKSRESCRGSVSRVDDDLSSFFLQDGRTALHLASAAGHIETVTALTLNGADVSAQDLVSEASGD